MYRFFFSLVILFFSFISITAQNYYESSFPELQDEIYYPQIDSLISAGNFDAFIGLSDEAFNYYYKQGETERAMYLFNLFVYFPSGYGRSDISIPKIKEKIIWLKESTDTMNVHFASLLYINAEAHIRSFQLEKAKPIFMNAISLLEKVPGVPSLHLYQAYKSAAFLHVYLYDNKVGYRLANLGLNGFLSEDMNKYPEGKGIQITYDIAYSYLTLAVLMKQIQQTELSLEYNKKALNVFKSLSSGKENTAISSINIADNYLTLGNPKRALKYLNDADSIIKVNDFYQKLKTSYISVLANKGKALSEMGHYKSAYSTYIEFKDFLEENFDAEEPLKAKSFIMIAENFDKQNMPDSALYYYEKAQIYNPDDVDIAFALADISNQKNDPALAYKFSLQNLEHYFSPLKANQDIPNADWFRDKYNGGIASHLCGLYLYKLYKKSENITDLKTSVNYFLLSDTLIGMHRDATLIGADEIKMAEIYHDIADAGIESSYEAFNKTDDKKYLDVALNFITQSTAFMLNAEVKQSVLFKDNANKNLHLKQIDIMKKIRQTENKLQVLTKDFSPEFRKLLSDSLFNYRKQAFELSFQIQYNDNDLVSNDLFSKINTAEVQQKLNEDEALIAYFFGNEHLYTFYLEKDNIKLLRVETDELFDKTLENYYKGIKTTSANFKIHSEKLYGYLIQPIENDLKNIKYLSIIPDGRLNQIPFEALMKNKDDVYLIEDYAISYNYSVFLWLRSREFSEENNKLSFVGFAPVFFSSEEPIDDSNPLSYNDELRGDYSEISDGDFLKPLPYSEEEVKEIQKLFENKSKDAKVFIGKDANEHNLKNNINEYSIVHLATHGFSSKNQPELSGLFLHSSINENDELTNDGFLYLGEIFNIKSDADLIVLSACKTGAGRIIKGEGVLALPRAFIFAGVPNLAASLWKIHDEKTKNLMISFYKNLLTGENYTKAMQSAKIDQINKGELPTDWSGIILIGR